MNVPDRSNDNSFQVFEAEYLPNRVLHIVVNGQPAVITPLFQHLHRGVAILRDAVEAEFPWVNNLVYHGDGDVTRVDAPHKIVGGTDDPIVVCLAIRYEEALQEGNLRVGPVALPSLEEAHREIEAYDCGVIQEPSASFRR
jgi:hypothetical protein